MRAGMLSQPAAIARVLFEHYFRKKAALREHAILRHATVTFTEQQTIAVRVLRFRGVYAECGKVERDKKVHAGEGGCDMRSPAGVRHPQNSRTHRAGACL
jgi:hypothetical protein